MSVAAVAVARRRDPVAGSGRVRDVGESALPVAEPMLRPAVGRRRAERPPPATRTITGAPGGDQVGFSEIPRATFAHLVGRTLQPKRGDVIDGGDRPSLPVLAEGPVGQDGQFAGRLLFLHRGMTQVGGTYAGGRPDVARSSIHGARGRGAQGGQIDKTAGPFGATRHRAQRCTGRPLVS